jgi:ComF family protein
MPRPHLCSAIRHWSRYCLDALLPRHCVLCGQPGEHDNLCGPCRADLPRPGHVCAICALPVAGAVDRLCGRCLLKPPPWERATAALAYRYPVDRIACRFKFSRDLACGHLLGCAMLAAIHAEALPLPDLVVPVPLHRLRHVSRTFNQAGLLAGQLGRALGVPVLRTGLLRMRATRAQSGLDAAGRRRNTRGAFRCPGRSRPALAGRHLALVDDVMTTGSTLHECTQTLRRAGVSRVSVWVAARAPAP